MIQLEEMQEKAVKLETKSIHDGRNLVLLQFSTDPYSVNNELLKKRVKLKIDNATLS